MNRRHIKLSLIVFIVWLVLINLPFLPGPNFLNAPAQILFTIGQLLGLLGLICVPAGIIWIVISITKKSNRIWPLIFSVIFLAPLVSLIFLTNILQHFSREVAIRNGNKLVTQLENFRLRNGYYPGSIYNSDFKIPHSWIIGIEGYRYVGKVDNFEISFFQNVLLGFNFEIVTYNKRGEQEAQGEAKELFPTSDKNWKYEIYD